MLNDADRDNMGDIYREVGKKKGALASRWLKKVFFWGIGVSTVESAIWGFSLTATSKAVLTQILQINYKKIIT